MYFIADGELEIRFYEGMTLEYYSNANSDDATEFKRCLINPLAINKKYNTSSNIWKKVQFDYNSNNYEIQGKINKGEYFGERSLLNGLNSFLYLIKYYLIN